MKNDPYPKLSQNIHKDELIACYTLDDFDWNIVKKARTKTSQLALAITLKTFQNLGYFVEDVSEIPQDILNFIKKQLSGTSNATLSYYYKNKIRRYRLREMVRKYMDIASYHPEEHQPLLRKVLHNQAQQAESFHALVLPAVTFFRESRIEIPTRQELFRFLASITAEAENELFLHLSQQLSAETKDSLYKFLQTEKPHTESLFHWVKKDPGKPSVATFELEVQKLLLLQQFTITSEVLSSMPLNKQQYLAKLAHLYTNTDMARFSENKRNAILSSFIMERSTDITDHLIDIFIDLMQKISSKSEQKIAIELVKEAKTGKYNRRLLYDLAVVLLGNPSGVIEETVFPKIPKDKLEEIVEARENPPPSYQMRHYEIMASKLAHHYKRILLLMFQNLTFQSTSAHQWLIKAISILKSTDIQRKRYLKDVPIPDSGIDKSWQGCMFKDVKNKTKVVKRYYELWIAQKLTKGLKNGDVWVKISRNYSNWNDFIPVDWNRKRDFYLQRCNLLKTGKEFCELWHKRLQESLETFNKNISGKKHIDISDGLIHLSKLKARNSSEQLDTLRDSIFTQIGKVNLLDMVVDVDNIIGFTDCFSHLAGGQRRDRTTLRRYLFATLFSYGTNIGPVKMAMASEMEYSQLVYIKKWYLYEEALKQANAMIVNRLHELRASEIWGDGTSCASDARMFPAYDHNLFSRWYNRYGGNVILVYWHVADKYVSIYSQVDKPSASQVLLMFEGIMKHDTEMAVEKNFVDSHGQSEVGFAFAPLLGFMLMARLKRIKYESLYRPEKGFAYRNLEPIMTRHINWKIIEQEYETIAKITVAIREFGVSPKAILRRFNSYSLKNSTYKAILEFGKINKTIFLCDYLPSLDRQYEVQEALNKVESWNSLTTFISYGDGGEMKKRQLSDQIQSIACMQLIQNCVIFWNTLAIDRLFSKNGQIMNSEQLKQISPLLHRHINPYGKFDVDLDGSGVLEGLNRK